MRLENTHAIQVETKKIVYGTPVCGEFDTECWPYLFSDESIGSIIALGQQEALERYKAEPEAIKAVSGRTPERFFGYFQRVMEEGNKSKKVSSFPLKIMKFHGVRLNRKISFNFTQQAFGGESIDIVALFEGAIDESISKFKDRMASIISSSDRLHWFENEMTRIFRLERHTMRRSISQIPDNPASYKDYQRKLLSMNPKDVIRELANARKDAKNVDRCRNSEYFIDDMYYPMVELPYFYGVLKIFDSEVISFKSYLSRRFCTCFLHSQQRFLDHIIPALHPICELFLRSRRFMSIAKQAYQEDAQNFEALLGAFWAAANIYRYYCDVIRTTDSERKKTSKDEAYAYERWSKEMEAIKGLHPNTIPEIELQ